MLSLYCCFNMEINMPELQSLFRARETLDSRNFNVWYHNDDVKALIWSFFEKKPMSDVNTMLDPFVFFDGIGDNGVSFDSLMDLCRKKLEASDKSYFPFIFKPEIGGAHYMAAILRKDAEGIRLFLFNPLGYSDKKLVQKRLLLSSTESSGGMSLVMSPHPVQNIVNEDGPLVSCGPLCVEFLKHAIQNPQWVADLDDAFSLPEHLMQLVGMEQSLYQQKIMELRQIHDAEIGTILDENIEVIDDFFASATEYFIEAIQSLPITNDADEGMSLDDYDSYSSVDDEFYYSTFENEDVPENPVESDQNKSNNVHDTFVTPFAYDLNKINQARLNFDGFLSRLKIKTDQLIDKANKNSPNYNLSYESVAHAAKKLNDKLETARDAFFKAPDAPSFALFKDAVDNATSEASKEFSRHRGVWHNLDPILKGVLGVLATLSVIPALIVFSTSRHGYINTFFSSPKTDAENELQRFNKGLDGVKGEFEHPNDDNSPNSPKNH